VRVDLDCGVVQPAGAPRVSEPAPCRDDRARTGGDRRRRRRKLRHERLVRREHTRHLRLMQHHLGNEDRPAVARRAPRQVVAPVRAVPLAERRGHVVVVVEAALATPTVNTIRSLGWICAPALGFMSMTTPTLFGSTLLTVDTFVKPFAARSDLAASTVDP